MQRIEESRLFIQKLVQNPPVLPLEPTLLPKLFSVTRENSTASTNEIVALIEHSQTLTARILTLANSASYGLRFKVTTLQRAVTILGTAEIRLLAIFVAVSSFINQTKLPKSFDAAGIWKHQLSVACIVKSLAIAYANACTLHSPTDSHKNMPLVATPSEMYVMGLLHDLGKFCIASRRPDIWEQIEELREKKNLPLVEAETQFWGIDHSLVGATLLHNWNLPQTLTDPITWHHTPDLMPVYSVEANLLAAANIIARQAFDETTSISEEAVSLLPPTCDTVVLESAVKTALETRNDEEFLGLIAPVQ